MFSSVRSIIITVATAIGLLLVIIGLSILFDFHMSNDLNPLASHAPKKRGIVCTKEQEITLGLKKVCIYNCDNGERTRIDGMDKCLREMEL